MVRTDEAVEAVFHFMGRGVVEAMRCEDFDALLSWVERNAPAELAKTFGQASSEDAQHLACRALATVIWADAPLPENGFRPRPRPRPGRNDPCPCGSGRKYKRCCDGALSSVPPLPRDALWDLIAPDFQDSEIVGLLEEPDLPLEALAPVAHQAAERGHAALAFEALQSRFAPGARLDERHAPALDEYLDLGVDEGPGRTSTEAYREWAFDVAARLPAGLRCAVLLRLAHVAMGMDDPDQAHSLLERARRDDPDHPGLGPTEVLLLLRSGELQAASDRARFHLTRMRRQGVDEDMPEAALMLELAAADPESARAQYTADGQEEGILEVVLELQTFARDAAARPVRPYAVETDEDGSVLKGPPKGVAAAERAWRRAWPEARPALTAYAADLPPEVLEEPQAWMEVLRKRPEAFDSLEVLDDLARLAFDFVLEERFAALKDVLVPLGERAAAIVRASLEGQPGPPRLAWLSLDNRPALRLLSLLAWGLDSADREEEARAVYEEVLALNPTDNHGHRAWLINHHLRSGADARALEIGESYPDDMDVSILFGRGLALWRLGRREEAEADLRHAAAARPQVVRYLLAKRPKKPPMHPEGFAVGGRDEAWFYRQEMRATWEATPGAMDFLRSLPKPPPSRRRRS